jgi:hypothetical protein
MATETNETVELARFNIPDCNLNALRDRISRLSKRAVKLVGQPITMKVIEVKDVEEKDAWNRPTGRFHRFHVVTVEGPQPRLNGWEFVAAMDVVQLGDGQNSVIVRTAPGKTMPAEIRNHPLDVCDHCRTHRARKSLYVLHKES